MSPKAKSVGCLCSGLGVYIAWNPPAYTFQPCAKHPLEVKPGQSWHDAAAFRVVYCVKALAAVRELLWPAEDPAAKWTNHTLAHVAAVLEFLRPVKGGDES